MNPGRRAALRALLAVERGTFDEVALAREAPEVGNDRALAWNLVRGVLRHRGELDAIISVLARRPVEQLDPVPRNALRIGLYEIRATRVPVHAAVNEAVELCRVEEVPWTAGFVNAVLRRHRDAPAVSPRAALSHPSWLISRWEDRYGREAAWAWAARNNEPPPLAVVLKEDADRLPLEAAGLALEPASAAGTAVPGAWWLRGTTGAVPGLPGFEAGRFWVQDPAAVAVADLVEAPPGARVLDACAAPGGKSFRLALRGLQVLAVDRAPERLAQVGEGAARLGLGVETRVHDWEAGPLGAVGEGFAAVLVDAPCSGLGTLRRHPEIRWRRGLSDLASNGIRQGSILESASQSVAEGGLLVYAVCSPEPEEGTAVVEAFLARNERFRLERTWSSAPPAGDEDAFQAASLRRIR